MPSLPPSSPAPPQGKLNRMQTKEKNNRPFCFLLQQQQGILRNGTFLLSPGFLHTQLIQNLYQLSNLPLNCYPLFISAVGRQDAPTTTSSPRSHSSWTLLNYIKLSSFFLQEKGSRKPSSSHKSAKVRSAEGGGTEELSGGEITLHWK